MVPCMVSKNGFFCNNKSLGKVCRGVLGLDLAPNQNGTRLPGYPGWHSEVGVTGALPFLSAIGSVDAHIFRGEITGPEARGLMSCVEIDDHLNLFFQQAVAGGAFVKGKRLTVAQHWYSRQVDVHAMGIEPDAGAPRRSEDAAPVRIATGKGGLDQRRGRDGLGDAARVSFRLGVTHFDLDDALRSFAVGDDLQSQRVANLFESFGKGSMR